MDRVSLAILLALASCSKPTAVTAEGPPPLSAAIRITVPDDASLHGATPSAQPLDPATLPPLQTGTVLAAASA